MELSDLKQRASGVGDNGLRFFAALVEPESSTRAAESLTESNLPQASVPESLSADEVENIFEGRLKQLETLQLNVMINDWVKSAFTGPEWTVKEGARLIAWVRICRDCILKQIRQDSRNVDA